MIPAITGKTAMLADSREVEPATEYVMEPKYDGHRIIAVVGNPEVTLYARSGVDKTRLMPNIARELGIEFPAGTVLDGEVVHWTDTGGDWARVQSILGSNDKEGLSLTYVVFDCLAVLSEDVRLHPQHVRRGFLDTMFDGADFSHLRLTEQYPYDADRADALMADGWEGAILKPVNGVYRAGRHTGGWLKIKQSETVDVVVIGATPGKGRFTGQIGALEFALWDGPDGSIGRYRGQCSGMTDEMRDQFTQMHNAGTLTGTVIEVRHMGKHPTGGWKSPQFKRIRTDKAPQDCVTA